MAVGARRAEEWGRLRQCLAVYRTWGLAERDTVEALERLLAREP